MNSSAEPHFESFRVTEKISLGLACVGIPLNVLSVILFASSGSLFIGEVYCLTISIANSVQLIFWALASFCMHEMVQMADCSYVMIAANFSVLLVWLLNAGLAVCRYFAVCRPLDFHRRYTARFLVIQCLVILTLSSLVTVPMVYLNIIKPTPENIWVDLYYCNYTYLMALTIVSLIIGYSYLRIVVRLNGLNSGLGSRSDLKNENRCCTKQPEVMFCCMLVSFVLLNWPSFILKLYLDFSSGYSYTVYEEPIPVRVLDVTISLQILGMVFDPCFYFVFREDFQSKLTCGFLGSRNY